VRIRSGRFIRPIIADIAPFVRSGSLRTRIIRCSSSEGTGNAHPLPFYQTERVGHREHRRMAV